MKELLDVLNDWTERYGLDGVDRTNLSLAVGWAVRGEKRYPPMPAELATKLGVRTFAAAMERFLLERFGYDDPPECASPEVHVPPAPVEEPPKTLPSARPHIPPAPRIRRKAVVPGARCCRWCSTPGHRVETCPVRIAAGAPMPVGARGPRKTRVRADRPPIQYEAPAP